MLNGTVNPRGAPTTYYFQYGTSTAYGAVTATANAGSSQLDVSVQAAVSGLTPGTSYHFRLAATNSYGTRYGSDVTFTTSPAPPSPVAAFTYSPAYPVMGSVVSFDASTSTCTADPCSYLWANDNDNSQLGTDVAFTYTFEQAGTQRVRLTVTDAQSLNGTVEHDVIITSSTSPGGPLTWSPPSCGDATHACVEVYLTNTASHQEPTLDTNTDYRLHLPMSGALVGGLTISGGRNVQIIGGEIDLSYPCSEATSACLGIYISRGSASGTVYIEGVYIRNPDPNYLTDSFNTGDGITANNYPGVTDIVLQNVRIEGIKGCDPAVPEAHSDVFQPYNAGNATIRVDRLTGTTDCQGMQIDPDIAYKKYKLLPKSGTFKNVNINVFANPSLGNGNRYVWWFTYGLKSCVSYPITLSNVYVQEPSGSLATGSVWPDPANTYPAGCLGLYPGGYVTWPTLTTLNGVVMSGLPPGGDYVPVGSAGVGYVSPGYQ
jgi:hypothetical protein